MKIVSAIVLYSIVLLTFMHNWLVVSFGVLVLFSIWFGAAFFIPAAIMIDGYFGNYYSFPYLSLLSVVWFMLIEYIRPKIIDVDTV